MVCNLLVKASPVIKAISRFKRNDDDVCELAGSSWCGTFDRTGCIQTVIRRCELPKTDRLVNKFSSLENEKNTYDVTCQVAFLEKGLRALRAFVWLVSTVDYDMSSDAGFFELLLAYGTLDSTFLKSYFIWARRFRFGWFFWAHGSIKRFFIANKFTLCWHNFGLDWFFLHFNCFRLSNTLSLDFTLSNRFRLILWSSREVFWRFAVVKTLIVTVEIIFLPEEVVAFLTSEATSDSTCSMCRSLDVHGSSVSAAALAFSYFFLSFNYHYFGSLHITAIKLQCLFKI